MQKQKISKIEIIAIIIFLLLLIILSLKSIVFDEVKNLSPAEQQFKDFVEYSVAQEYSGILSDMHLMVYRVYDIEMANKKEKAVLKYEDPKTGEMIKVVQNGRYNAGVRGYLLWILPIKQFDVTAKIEE